MKTGDQGFCRSGGSAMSSLTREVPYEFAGESFAIVGPMRGVETIASGKSIRDLIYPEERFGPGNWRKLKGFGAVRLEEDTMHEAEIHWYEAEVIGMQWAKIKRFVESPIEERNAFRHLRSQRRIRRHA